MLEAKYRKPQQYDIFIDYLFTHAKVATLEDDTWKVSWEKLRELTEDDVRNFAWRFAKYNNFPVDEVTRQFLEEWKSKPAEILYPYSDNIIVKFRRDLYDKYLLTILQFKYKRVEQIEKKRIKYDVYLYSIHPTLRMTFVLRRGLLTYLPEVLEAYKHPLGSQLPPNPPGPEYPPEGPGEWLRLRPYQWEVLQSIWRNFRTLGAATVRMAAGTGKTEVAVAVTKALRQVMPDRFDKVFFITLNTLLLWQAKRRFEKYGVKAGLVTHQYFDIDQPVVCCTVQTLFKALYPHKEVKTVYIGDRERAIEFIRLPKEKYALLRDAYLSSNLVIIDECHHIPARTVLKVLTAHPYALRLALSATPWRDDESKWEIYATCGKIIEPVVNASYATKLGYLVPAYIIFYILDLPEYAQTWQLKGKEAWHLVENLVFLNEKRHKIVADIAEYCVNLNLIPTMILVRRIPQGEFITNELLSRGIRAVFLHGGVDLSTRESIVRATERLSFEVLIATQLADEGFDLPPMRALILASGGKSSTRALQRVGRVVRPIDPKRYPEAAKLGPKKWGIVVDIADNAKFLLKHAQMREVMYRTEDAWKITAVASKVDLFKQLEYANKLQKGLT